MVRLITHNLLACHVKGCTTNNFPLQFRDVQIELREAEFNPEFLKGFMPKVEWNALVDAARQLGDTTLPPEIPEMLDDDFLKNLHHVLLEIHVEEGVMSCPNCKHDYPILNGIPNMNTKSAEILSATLIEYAGREKTFQKSPLPRNDSEEVWIVHSTIS